MRSSVLAGLAAAASCVARASLEEASVVPATYLFKVRDGHDLEPVVEELEKEGTIRLKLAYSLFTGVSVRLKETAGGDAEARATALASSIKAIQTFWPVMAYPTPPPQATPPGSEGDANEVETPGRVRRDSGSAEEETTTTPRDTYSPHVMAQVDKLRAKGLTGKGIRVAIIDSGIDYTHPALGGCFGDGCLVSFGRDLAGNGSDPMDCDGHGTTVAG